MRAAKSFALLTASALLLTACDVSDLFSQEESVNQTADHSDQRYAVGPVKEQIGQLQDNWKTDGKEAEVQALIDRLLKAANDSYAVYLRAEMQYYADWDSTDLTALHTETAEDYYVVSDAVSWAMTQGAAKSAYAELFQPYADEDNKDYFLSQSLSRVISNARSSAGADSALLDDYYSTAYDEELSEAETNEACAQLYLDAIESYDTSKYLYDYYGRDYTVEDASGVYHEIVESLVPVFEALGDRLQNDPRSKKLSSDFSVTEPFDTIRQYAPQISDKLSESIELLTTEKLYTVGTGDSCYDGSYTVSLPGEQRAIMYLYRGGGFYDFITSVHEFGHFHADWRDQTPIICQQVNLDLAEVQSQGLELLFTHFYPDIFGSDAEYLELSALYNIIDSVVSGFAVGEFEYEVMQRGSKCKPKDVLEIYDRIHDECGLGIELYQISHLFEQPGYYVSYGVSALAALQIYTAMQQDFRAAAEQYERIAAIPSMSGEYSFREALEKAGFSDIFAEDCIEKVIAVLDDRSEQLAA